MLTARLPTAVTQYSIFFSIITNLYTYTIVFEKKNLKNMFITSKYCNDSLSTTALYLPSALLWYHGKVNNVIPYSFTAAGGHMVY